LRIALVTVLAVLAASLIWLAGEQHRKNCLSTGRVGCSVLPWDSGDRPMSGPLDTYGCEQLVLLHVYDGVENGPDETPPECR
jgi:hypothetical protein